MAGEHVKVAIEGLHVGLHVGYGLRAVEQNLGAVAVGHFDHFVDGGYSAERVGDLREGNEARLLSEQSLIFVEQDLAAVVHWDNAQLRALLRTKSLPGHDVGVVLEPGDDDFVVFLDVLASPTLGDEVNAFGCAAHKNNFAHSRRVDKAPDFFTGTLVSIGGASRKFMRGAMNVGIFVLIKMAEPVNYALRLLCGGGVIEPDQGLAMHTFLQDRKIAANGLHVERL